jgi:diadenosine tetraphosphate (Ap4A) HIT family hydrolase
MVKTKEITNYKGGVKKISCLACAREKSEINLGDIVKSAHFDAHQDYEVPIPGFIIISSRRHFKSVDEFTEKEQKDFIKFLFRLRSAMRQVLGIRVVHIFHREDTAHHFHFCLMPRYGWMKKFGEKIESARPIVEFAKKNLKAKNNINKVDKATRKLKQFFKNNKSYEKNF